MKSFLRSFLVLAGAIFAILVVVFAANPEKHPIALIVVGGVLVLICLAFLAFGVAVTIKPEKNNKKGKF